MLFEGNLARPNGVLGLSTADNGSFSYPCLPVAPTAVSGLTFSAERCLVLREKVDIDKAGLDDEVAAALVGWEEGFSGDKEVARLAEGVLLCEDVRDVEVLLVVPLESFVRRLALRER